MIQRANNQEKRAAQLEAAAEGAAQQQIKEAAERQALQQRAAAEGAAQQLAAEERERQQLQEIERLPLAQAVAAMRQRLLERLS